MGQIYTRKINVKSELVDFQRKMKISSFMELFQECCIAHTEELGMGRHMTLDKGFLWVILSEHIIINRLPEYDENIILESTPGVTLHYFFPRNIVVKTESGEELIKANAMWALIDQKTRHFIDPSENGIIINGVNNKDDVMPAMGLKVPELKSKKVYTANYSLVDINGHLSNIRYMDLMCDEIYKNEKKFNIKEIFISFKKEIPIGQKFIVSNEKKENKYFFKSKYFESNIVL